MNVNSFLACETPDKWLSAVPEPISTLLIDHANCEKKAASTALNLLYRYVDKYELMLKLSKLAREELRHFEQVLAIMGDRNVSYGHVSPGRYASTLHSHVRKNEPDRLVDVLIVGAVIEARSCERFSKLVEILDDELAGFYQSLLKSEARHANVYLDFAKSYSGSDFDDRLAEFVSIDQELVTAEDETFRFHSGVPT